MNAETEDLLVAWYADDFTGAAAVLEVLAFAGLQTMLFLDVPTRAQLSRYPDLQAIGVASTARAQSPEWMDNHLPGVFESLLALNPGLFHYKICSTLDSSPDTGSIGRAIEIAADLIKPEMVPVLVAAPQMRRYQMFGHLFAGLGDKVYRLDRHPVMARHPVTPMTESDVARHIALQSKRLDTAVWSFEDSAATLAPELGKVAHVASQNTISVLTIDCVDDKSETAAGRLLWENKRENRFVVGSQGVEYALVRHWIETDVLPASAPLSGAGRSQGMVTVSGSVSPTTAEQIAWSRKHGFAVIRFDVIQATANETELEGEITRVVSESLQALTKGLDPLIYTAQGPDDPTVRQFKDAVAAAGHEMPVINKRIGLALGAILHRILTQSNIRRAVVSGGDTSGYVTQQLGIFALSALAPTIPGASLSRVHADGPMDGLELALKGGQMGSPDYFGWIRDGGGAQ
ncbi:MAG: four-carbon acid sugar kinase family protein [Granulosicoccus sp.]